ncbi:zinc ribbon domain-containing protein [Corynebacterium epidermidicanis]|uniref:Zn-ribbon protein, possibly nucleic acid-binding n=1 Tax=Corynebacterium epidermidicanis TaxID=1050174 RepID=A0A0G3GXL9_9CORY|nr:C4-type zinc ribbon domain-containing protein [Corynebacterium epidermidicanis]AKK03602.1 Zn-ribbon protein, possibly nucleic acid-binding [Corynebacterium epidermidicanis]
MKITPTEQKKLLELANLERTLDAGLRKQLPEDAEVTKLREQADRKRSLAASAQLNVADLELEIRRIQSDMTKLNRRISADKQGLGAATDADQRRDLEHDLVSAQRRLSDMQQELKEAHDEIHALRANVDRNGAELDEIERKLAAAQRAAESAQDAEDSKDRSGQAAELRVHISAEALAAYDEQRAIFGVGAAEFTGRTCGGCHLVLPPAALAEIRATPADEMPRCPDCGTYLVRR